MKENEELQMLYHINEEMNQKKTISINNAKSEIVNQCLNDMNAFIECSSEHHTLYFIKGYL